MAKNLIVVLSFVLLFGCQQSQKTTVGSQVSESQSKDTIQLYNYLPLSDQEKRRIPILSLIDLQTGKEINTYYKLDSTYQFRCQLAYMNCHILLSPIDGVEISKVKGENNIFNFRFKKPKATFEVFADCGFEKLVNHSRYYDSTTNKMMESYYYLNGVRKMWTEEIRLHRNSK